MTNTDNNLLVTITQGENTIKFVPFSHVGDSRKDTIQFVEMTGGANDAGVIDLSTFGSGLAEYTVHEYTGLDGRSLLSYVDGDLFEFVDGDLYVLGTEDTLDDDGKVKLLEHGRVLIYESNYAVETFNEYTTENVEYTYQP